MGTGSNYRLPTAAFDTVLATFPAGYVLEESTLREARRVLTKEGRLVILGLWVQVDLGGLERLVPVFYGKPSQAALDRMTAQVTRAGFVVTLHTWRDGGATVGGLVADVP